MYSVSAPAKIIFCGEHAVVFGSDAIASAIDLRTFATIHIAETHTITLMDLDFTSEFNPKTGVIARKTVKPAISDAILALLAIIKNVPSLEKVPPFHVKVKSDVPVGMGMGSSAAYCVCLSACLLLFSGSITPYSMNEPLENNSPSCSETKIHIDQLQESDPLMSSNTEIYKGQLQKSGTVVSIGSQMYKDQRKSEVDLRVQQTLGEADLHRVNALAHCGESVLHSYASGIDSLVSTFGKSILFSKTNGVRAQPGTKILVINSGIERSTSAQMTNVSRFSLEYPLRFAQIIVEIKEVVRKISGALADPKVDWDNIGRLMEVNHGLLNSCGVGHQKLDEIKSICNQYGVYCKLSGAGGGGICFGVGSPEKLESEGLMRALGESGFMCNITEIGANGLCICAEHI